MPSAFACTCLHLEPRDIIEHSAIVFEGEVGDDFNELKVTEVFKGRVPSTVQVRFFLGGPGSCGLSPLGRGNRLVVVADSLNNLGLNVCNTYPQSTFGPGQDDWYVALVRDLRARRRQ